MASHLTILLGEAGTGKTSQLLQIYREALAVARQQRRPGTTLWIAPTHRTQQAIVDRLLTDDCRVQFAPQVLTFETFAEQILAAAGKPATLMAPVVKRLLLRRIVADLGQRGQLPNFQAVIGTTGFLDVVSGFISELKREEVWPDDFLEACVRRGGARSKRDRELGLIYARYQQHLNRQNWYDVEGRFWLARTALNDGVRGPFAAVETLIVDGFADFTETQYEILGRLMHWMPRAFLSIPCEEPIRRTELFGKPGATLPRLRKHLPAGIRVQIVNPSPVRGTCPAGLQAIAADLFSNPRQIEPRDDARGIELIAATGPHGEWQSVATRIKKLLLNGVAPTDIVVAVRAVSESGPGWRDVLQDAGIPVWCEAGSPLSARPIVKALFSVLQLELDDWPFARLLQVLGSNYFQPNWPDLSRGHGARVVGTALRRLKLHAGRERILTTLGRVASGLAEDADPDLEFIPHGKSSIPALARRAEGLLRKLAHVTDRLHQKRSLTDWSDVMALLGADLGWPPRTPVTPEDVRDAADWDLLQRTLRTAGEADRRLVLSADTKSVKLPRLDLASFVAELRDMLDGEQIRATADPGGCVRILDVEQARHLDPSHLFVVGLSESSFPRGRSDDCLFSEAERREFARRGLPLKDREQHQRDEMFLFYSIVTRARTSLTLSYPAINAKGQPLFASPYVSALRALFRDAALAPSHEGQLDPVPEPGRVLTETDLRLAAVREALRGRGGLFAYWGARPNWSATCENLLAAVAVNVHRFHETGLTEYEGRLRLEANLAILRQRFGPQHQFSATQLEAYATCPFRFWVEEVLKIEDLPTPEEGTDYIARGSLVHVVLAQMLREGLDRPEEELARRFQELVEEQLSRRLHETDLQRALTAIESRLLARWGEAFGKQQVNYARQVSEVWTSFASLPPEIPFGAVPGQDLDPELQEEPLVFGESPHQVRLRGRIDRVDTGRCEGRPVFNVIDYKTGAKPRSSMSDLEAGRGIQLALYAMAVQQLGLAGSETRPFQIGLWSLRGTGFKRGYQRDNKALSPMDATLIDSLEQTLQSVIPQLAAGIRQGKFLVENADENCTSHCPHHTACRVNQIRPLRDSLRKVADILAASEATAAESDASEAE